MGVSTYNFNNNNFNKKPNRDALYHAIMLVSSVANGMAVGGTICHGVALIKNGYDNAGMMLMLLYLMCAIYTGHTAYRIYQAKKKIDNNQNQR